MTGSSTSVITLYAFLCALVLGTLAGCNDDNDNNGGHSANYSAACGQHSWCDTTLSPDQRADRLVAKLKRGEKFDLMAGDFDLMAGLAGEDIDKASHAGGVKGIPRLGIPSLYITDGSAGVRSSAPFQPDFNPPTDPGAPSKDNETTGWPAPIALAATWDPELAHDYGAGAGTETKTLGLDLLLGPDVNIMRTPLNGRSFEAYGEDPELTSQIAVAWIKGVQSQGVMADVKHFVANNQEENRNTINAKISQRTLRELYLPAFHAAVDKAHVATVMEAYNSVNGEHMTQNAPLVLDTLKKDWGFKGVALTDYYAAQQSTVASANAGNDLELPVANFYTADKLGKAVDDGKISIDTINDHVHRLLRTMFAFDMFDTPADAPPAQSHIPDSLRQKHSETSRKIEESAITLLKNENSALPLKPTSLNHVAVIGSLADRYQAGQGSAFAKPFYAVTPLQGIRNRVADLPVTVSYDDGSDRQTAVQKAKSADVAIVVVGDFEGEAVDRPCLGLDCLPGAINLGAGQTIEYAKPLPDFPQNTLISQVAAAQPNTIVVVEAGAPVLMAWIDSVPAVIDAYYPGEEGGNAIASVLFGDVNPSGHLPFTIPAKASDLAVANNPIQYPGKDNQEQYSEGVFVGYRHYDEANIKPLFAFGHGLSYTQFKFSGLSFHLTPSGGSVSAYVSNTGSRPGAAVAQLYLGLPDTKVPEPPKWLRGFKKVQVAPGEAKQVKFKVSQRDLSYWDSKSESWQVAPGCYEVMLGASSRDVRLSGKQCFNENAQ